MEGLQPIAMQNSAGGTEATEVTSLLCGVDATENVEIIAAGRSLLHNQTDTNSVSCEGLKT